MAQVKWVKITTDMFDNRKIKHLRRLPEGNNIVLIWVMLLTMAGRCNAGGMIFLTENIPYTTKMLADELGFEENTVILAIQMLEQFSMIKTDQGYFSIAGWNEYQNIEGMDRIREQNRIRKQRQRERQKALPEPSRDITGQVTQNHATDKEEDIDKESKKKNKSVKEDTHALFTRLLPEYALTEAVAAKMSEWIRYKTERKEGYKETGLRTLLRRIESNTQAFGEEAIIQLIDDSMASDWKGIIFDRLGKQAQPIPRRTGGKKQSKAEELNGFYNMAANWAAEGE